MSLIIRMAFIILCAYAGSVAGGAEFMPMPDDSQLASE
jgi:hypothetical protein